eukprot:5581261-Prymnesium_polylepis.1
MHLRGAWHFPAVCGTPLGHFAPRATHVVNVVLAPTGAAPYAPLLVDGVPCVTLGHGLAERGAAHPFWGTARVLAALRMHDGWADGRVVLGSPLRAPIGQL